MKSTVSFFTIVLVVALFAAFTFAGYRTSGSLYSISMLEGLETTLGFLKGLGPIALLFVIFINNSVKALLVILLGVIPFVFPSIFVAMNGFILGLVINMSVASKGLGFTLIGLLPHGILELAATLLAAALGIQMGLALIKSLRQQEGQLGLQYKGSLRIYFKLILPALFLAAVIETAVGILLLPSL
ncbi:MAG: stage II sporulation protein M [Dehalococcoidia bacterium]|nr:stage II sporulation protein M [Dehalococcoidia bacterium]